MQAECLICDAPLKYLESDIEAECAICHKKEHTKAICVNGHYVCDQCHTGGLDTVVALCLKETSKNPVEIINRFMAQPFCHMHGPEHHILVGAALLTAFHNAGGKIDFEPALQEIIKRGKNIPGGVCGFWGACGAGISSGVFISVVTGSTPLAEGPWGMSNRMTSASLAAIGEINGPRCCKRDSYLAIRSAVTFARENLGVNMEYTAPRCEYSPKNNQCIGTRCPFFPAE